MIARRRRPGLLAVLIAVGGLLLLLIWLLAPGYAQTPPPPPEEAPPELGNPADLVAAPGVAPGVVVLRWTPAANAAAHFVYLTESGGDGEGRYREALPGDAGAATVAGLAPGRAYWFSVIAGRPVSDAAASWQWSQWTNWARGVAAPPPAPPTPSSPPPGDAATPEPGAATPTPESSRRGRIYGAEIAGQVLSVDADARTLVVRHSEYEHFGGVRPPNPLTVDYGWLAYFGPCLSSGQYIEIEGIYDLSGGVLLAYEMELESRRHCDDDDDDGDGRGDYDDRDDHDDHRGDDDH